ncbi:MAG: hypothetical protein WC414_04150, partial [Patescibacteria group bacterium]
MKNFINNDKLVISSNQSSNFVFNNKLTLGEEYDVNIIDDKNNQKCYLKNNSGIIDKYNIDNIEIMCGEKTALNYNPFTFVFNSLPLYTLTYRAGNNGN